MLLLKGLCQMLGIPEAVAGREELDDTVKLEALQAV